MKLQKNPIGQTFVTHDQPVHLILNYRWSGHNNEQTLCGKGSPSESTTITGYIADGEFDVAGNPMTVCERCKEELRTAPSAPLDRTYRYLALYGEYVRVPVGVTL